MTVKELKEALEKYPENMYVYIGEKITDFTYGLLEKVHAKEISFSEEPGSKPLAKDTVIILSEE